jgi:hypothetical protein
MVMIHVPPQGNNWQGPPPSDDSNKWILTTRIIWGALIASVLLFFAIVLTITASKPAEPALISFIGAGFAALLIIARFFIPATAAKSMIKSHVEPSSELVDWQLYSVYQTKKIIGMALLEGATFFNLICYMQERVIWTLGIIGVLLLLMFSMFPSLTQFRSWADDMKRDLQNQF